MNLPKPSGDSQDKANYLFFAFEEINKRSVKDHPVFYTLSIVRFNNKLSMLVQEPSTTGIREQIEKYSNPRFAPDHIIVELFTGRSRNVKPFAVYKLDYARK